MPATSLRSRLLFLLVALALLGGGLFNFIKPVSYSRRAHLQALAAARAGQPVVPIPEQDMVPIPPGSFVMGSPEMELGHGRDESPQHRVTVSGFRLQRYLVTQGQWQAVMGRNPSYFKGEDRLPVEGVTWYDCIEFCNLQSLRERRTPCYRYQDLGTDPETWPRDWKRHPHDNIACDWQADGFRLPTEAEWEYACRAGTTTATPYGPSLSSAQADFNGEHPYHHARKGPFLRRTAVVGSYPPNPWGLYDLLGNISQWCWDWYGDYPRDDQQDPRGAGPGSGRRVYRGGSWFNYGADLRSANRFHDAPQFRLDMLPGGVRLARRG